MIFVKVMLIVFGTLAVLIALRWDRFNGGHGSRQSVRTPRIRMSKEFLAQARQMRKQRRKERRKEKAQARADALRALFSGRRKI